MLLSFNVIQASLFPLKQVNLGYSLFKSLELPAYLHFILIYQAFPLLIPLLPLVVLKHFPVFSGQHKLGYFFLGE